MKTKRGLVTGLVDRFATRKLGFPPETCSYTVTAVRIPVSTSSEPFSLVADLYQPILPKEQKPAGTILIRSPYGRGLAFALLSARPHASRGYVCLLVSCRGTFGSEGVFDPWRNEEEDGHAAVVWMRKQEWYTGSFATLGGSYLGFVQWALLRNPPPDMAAAVIQCAPHDFSKQLWGTGSLALEWITWGETLSIQEKIGLVNTYHSFNSPKRIRPILDRLPLAESVKSHLNGRAPWLDFVVDNPDLSHPRYEQMNFTEALEKANIPIFLVGGWYDVLAQQTIEQFVRLSERNTNVALTIGPWNHMQVGLESKLYQQSFDWLEEHLAKRKQGTRKAPLQYFVTGAQEWRESQNWPPQTSQQVYYLNSGNRLDTSRPATQSTSLSTFTFDPQQPTPTMGGNLLLGGGSADDTTLATRSDVQTFTTEPLDQNIEVTGKIAVELTHSSDKSNVDLFVRVSEVNAKGRSHGITDTYTRLQPERSDNVVRLELRDCAHRFSKGSRIRLIVAGASHPQYARGEEKAVHTIHHGDTGLSKVVLPVTSK